MRKVRLDQTSAWFLAILIAIGLFVALYFISQKVSKDYVATNYSEELSIDPLPEEQIEGLDHDEEPPKEEVSPVPMDQIDAEWGYSGNGGPENWGKLSPDYSACQYGTMQSPINIQGAKKSRKIKPIKFMYKKTPVEVVNNGRTIEGFISKDNYLVLNSERFELVSIDFHLPSEHTVDGIPYDMEVHLTHKNQHKEITKVAVFFAEGGQNKRLKDLWNKFPQAKDEKNLVHFNPNNLLPSSKEYFYYKGSLTTPPCTEGVEWVVMKTPLVVSSHQVDQFIGLYKNNARSTQPLNSRKVFVRHVK